MIKRNIVSGIYVLDFNTCIKIGRSKDIFTRVKQYNGYRSEESVKKLLFVFTKEHKFIEKESHQFAHKFLPRMAKYEKFVCISGEEKMKFLEKYKEFLNTKHSDVIDEIVDQFEEEQKLEIIEPVKYSNLTIPIHQKSKCEMNSEIPVNSQYFFQQFAFKPQEKRLRLFN